MRQSRDLRRWADWTLAVLLVLSLVGFGIALFAIFVADEYGVPAQLTEVP